MPLQTRLTEKLRIDQPVLLAPMGSISGGALAAAVSDAGGLGLIGGGYGDQSWLEREFALADNKRIGCGFITWALCSKPHLVDFALAHRPVAIMLSFGDPTSIAKTIRQTDTVLICQVQNRKQTLEALDAGAEIIVAQGNEAGGHGGGRATLPLLPAVVDLVAQRAPNVLVVAAGGVVDGRGLAAALALGAEGVLVGTRFYASVESLAHEKAKMRIVASSGEDTVRTSVFDIVRGYPWPTGVTGRALANDFTNQWHGRECELRDAVDAECRRYWAAATEGDFDTAVVFGGEGVDLISDIPLAGDIVRRLAFEAERAIDAAAARII